MSFRFCGDGLCDGMFRAPARGTFALSGKSTQKRCLNLRFKNPPALCSAFCWGLTPRVHRTKLFSLCMTNQLSSCVAAAHTLNGRIQSVVRRRHQRQRRRGVKKTCRWHVFSLRSRRLCRRSIHLIFEGTTSPRHTIGAQCPFPHQPAAATREQRRFDNDATTRILRERAAGSPDSVQRAARREVKEPEVPSGAFAYFCHCWQK